MNTTLSNKELGRRVADFRKLKGLSQEELAAGMEISRSSLAQVELGNRGVSVLELKRLSVILGFSLDEFLADEFNLQASLIGSEGEENHQVIERVAIPALQVNKFRNILLYILEKCAGKPNVGETVLNKLLYFADFNYYEIYEEHLTGAVYRKLPYGPVPVGMESVLNRMIRDGQLERLKTTFYDLNQVRYIPLVKADLTILKASEKEVIDRVIEQMSDWSATAISNYSHKDMPWLASKEGDTINYELVFYREAPYSVRNYHDETP
jgi:transcriptional regulator with XRE-family HTH domain